MVSDSGAVLDRVLGDRQFIARAFLDRALRDDGSDGPICAKEDVLHLASDDEPNRRKDAHIAAVV
jgi:hypothetical protein